MALAALAGLLLLAACAPLATPTPIPIATATATIAPAAPTLPPAPSTSRPTSAPTPILSPTPRPTATATRTRRPPATATVTSSQTPAPGATPTARPTFGPSVLDRTENILLLGVDHRTGDPDPSWRTDSIMVAAIDRAAGAIGIISIPRDLYVEIPGVGQARINQADYYGEATGYEGGGPALVRRVLTETLGIPTQRYVRVQMDSLVRLVDALGGVTVTLECPIYERTPDETSPSGVIDWNLPAGQVFLDGETAKKFATYRYVTSDFGRAHRQQQLLWALRGRALQVDVIPRIPELWRALSDTFVTDFNLLDVIRLATFGFTLKPENVRGLVFSEDVLDYFVTEEGAWVLVVHDLAALEAEKEAIFAARPLAELGGLAEGEECPPPPEPAPTFTPTPAPDAVTPTAAP